jgi:nucleoside-diphosphate-sugar epimerase
MLWELLHDKSEDTALLTENFINIKISDFVFEPFQYRPELVVSSKVSKRILGTSSEEKNSVEEIKSRRTKRKVRTTKDVDMDIDAYRTKVKRYGFQFLKAIDTPRIFDYQPRSDGNVTRCGIEGQNAFILDNLLSFPSKRAINQDSVILITGILSRIGFLLALKLATECNIKVIIGIDAMYSNEYTSKRLLLEQIKLLYAQVRQLRKPLLVAFDGINPTKQYQRYSIKSYNFNEKTGDFDFEENAVPTHVLHVLSSEKSSFQLLDRSCDGRNGSLFMLRQSLTATEQLLQTLGDSSEVHFTLVSHIGALNMIHHKMGEEKDLFHTTKLMEEIMLHYYSKRLQFSSFVVLRVPTLYGPWGRPGSFDFDLTQKAIDLSIKMKLTSIQLENDSTLLSLLGDKSAEAEKDILFIDGKLYSYLNESFTYYGINTSWELYRILQDAISAIVSGMQYDSPYSNLASFNLLSGEKTSAVKFAKLVVSLINSSSSSKTDPKGYMEIAKQNDSSPIHSYLSSLPARKQLNWSPRLILRDGVEQLLAWHLDENLPFGPLSRNKILFNETGSQFLRRQDNLLCHSDDANCLIRRPFLPCASECSDPNFCSNSEFDESAQISRKLSENCEIVLYSAFLSDYTEDFDVVVAPQTDHHSICSIAFLLESSTLATELRLNHVDRKDSDDAISYKGWHIILVNMQQNQLSWKLRHLLKLTPRNFFHASVKAALYIPSNFPTNPEVDDILFITGLLHRHPVTAYSSNQQRVYFREMEQMNYMVGQTKRDALIILPGAAIAENPKVQHVMSGSYPTKVQQVSIEKGMRSMVDHTLWNDDEATRSHVEFEKDIANIFNNPNFESQTTSETFKFSHRHWTRKHWIVHNFEKSEAQSLRCDWYLEQIQWKDDSENISFAHILARMEFQRFHLFANEEDKSDMLAEQNSKHIDLQSDEYQWSMVTYPNSNASDIGYVRILDDRALMIERKLWQIRTNE